MPASQEPDKMKAIVCDGKKGVKLADVPEPELKEGQVLVKVKAAAQVTFVLPT